MVRGMGRVLLRLLLERRRWRRLRRWLLLLLVVRCRRRVIRLLLVAVVWRKLLILWLLLPPPILVTIRGPTMGRGAIRLTHICMPVRGPPLVLRCTRGSWMSMMLLSSVAAVRPVLWPTPPAPPTAARLLRWRSPRLLLRPLLLRWLLLSLGLLLLLRLLLFGLLLFPLPTLGVAIAVGVRRERMIVAAPVSARPVVAAPIASISVLTPAVPTRPILDTSVAPVPTGSDESVPRAILRLPLPCGHHILMGIFHDLFKVLTGQIGGWKGTQHGFFHLVLGRQVIHNVQIGIIVGVCDAV